MASTKISGNCSILNLKRYIREITKVYGITGLKFKYDSKLPYSELSCTAETPDGHVFVRIGSIDHLGKRTLVSNFPQALNYIKGSAGEGTGTIALHSNVSHEDHDDPLAFWAETPHIPTDSGFWSNAVKEAKNLGTGNESPDNTKSVGNIGIAERKRRKEEAGRIDKNYV